MTTFRILIVDDDPILRLVASTILTSVGYDVLEAEDGRVADGLMRMHSVDLVLLDMIMPNQEGIETIMGIKARNPDLKIIAISGGGRIMARDLLHWAKMAGADHVLTKPLTAPTLLDAVQTLLLSTGVAAQDAERVG